MLLSVAMISLISFGASAQNQNKKDRKEKQVAPTEQPAAADPAATQLQQAAPATDQSQQMSAPVQATPATSTQGTVQPDPAQAAPKSVDTITPGR